MPESLQERDKETKKLVEVLNKGISTFQGNADALKNEFDIVRMKSENVEKWLKAFGWKWYWPENRRLLLKLLIRIYKWRGTRDGIVNILRLFGGPEIELKEAWPEAYAAGTTIPDEEKIRCTVNLPDELWSYKTIIMRICGFMKPGHAIIGYLHSLLPVTILIEYRKRLFWQVRFLSGFPSTIIKLDQGYCRINGNFRLNNLTSIGPYRKTDGSWMILNGEITHHLSCNYQRIYSYGEYRPLGSSPDRLDTRYRLDGRYNLDYEVQDTRWFLNGAVTIGYEGYLDGGRLLNSSWFLNSARFLNGKITTIPRHFLTGYGHVSIQVEHKQLDGTWRLGKSVAAHRLAWVKWRDGQVVERGLAG